jgi:signal transduction histidine kinase
MNVKLRRIRSVRGPVILFVISLAIVIALLVLWNVVLAVDYRRIRELAAREAEAGGAFHWTFIALGSVLFVATIALFSILGVQLISEIRSTERQSSFIAMFTHELNSPLASIKLFAQTLRKPGLRPEEHERFLELILLDVERLRAQISNVLRAAQLEGPEGLHLAPEEVSLRAYLEDYTAARKVALEKEGGGAALSLAAGPDALVSIDRSVFRQVLDNLLDNAVKYARPGGVRIEVATGPASRPDRVALEVRDDGSGIDPRDAPHLFQRFRRGTRRPEGARRAAGTGLGLWIVQSIVKAHGGSVEARPRGPLPGTTIRIELPIAPGAASSPAQAAVAAEGAAT